MARSYEERMGMAQAALEAGFATKAARKDAMENVSRAFEMARGEIFNALISVPRETRSEAAQAMIDDLPHQLNHWRSWHAEAASAMFSEQVAKIEASVALRAAIKAAPEVERQPKPKTAAQLAWEADAMTCQVCGRPICAKTGVIAHHGYERPGWGYQTASCEGARELPFEVSRDALGKHIEGLKAGKALREAWLVEVAAERMAILWVWTDYTGVARFSRGVTHEERVRRDTYPVRLAETEEVRKRGPAAISFDALKAGYLKRLSGEIALLSVAIEEQTARFEGWKQTHRREAAAWVSV